MKTLLQGAAFPMDTGSWGSPMFSKTQVGTLNPVEAPLCGAGCARRNSTSSGSWEEKAVRGESVYKKGAAILALWFIAASVGTPSLSAVQPASPSRAAAPSGNGPGSAPATQAGEQDIRGLRPPYHLANPWRWVGCAAGATGVLVLGYGAWRRFRRTSNVPAVSLEDSTLRKLEEARALIQPDKARDFSIAVSEVIRGYVEQRFAVTASQLTTWEFLHYLTVRSDSPLAVYRSLLGEFLFHCDAAKFARWILSATEMDVMYQSARRFVKETGRPPVSKQERETDTATGGRPGEGTEVTCVKGVQTGPVGELSTGSR